jgi:hypothetical protein
MNETARDDNLQPKNLDKDDFVSLTTKMTINGPLPSKLYQSPSKSVRSKDLLHLQSNKDL